MFCFPCWRLVTASPIWTQEGYSEAYAPFCGLAIMEELSGHRTAVADPFLRPAAVSQPNLIDEMAAELG